MQPFTWQHFYWYLLFLIALVVGSFVGLTLTQERLFSSRVHAASVAAQATSSALTVTLTNATLQPGQQSALTATLRDSTGQPVADQLVVFYGGLGTITPASAVTDAEGRVNAVYTAGSRGGKAQVTVLAGYRAQSVPLQIESSGGQPGGGYRLFLPSVAR